jgi:uncharacterized protein
MATIENTTRQSTIASNIKIATNFFSRMRGLIGSKPLEPGHGFVIPHCKGVHTFGMTFPLDIIFVDSSNQVVGIEEHILPNKTGHVFMSAKQVIECPVGTILRSGTRLGDHVSIQLDS